ncbi:hypothetical protein AB0F43_27110 [Kribbella sp. NPDC023972]|uniref:hypothetical protein n=1 Tax=Kribbella sp. NPDC023972 TaxID=3154795 RepID=UPI003402499D
MVVSVGPGTVTVAVAVAVAPGTGDDDALLLPPIAARIVMKATPPATQPAISFPGGSAPYRPLGPRARSPREFSQKLQPDGAGGQAGSGRQPGGGCQFGVGGSGQPGGELNVYM